MGLDVSHDAFSGAYSAFMRFREAVIKAAGGTSEFDFSKGWLIDVPDIDNRPGLKEFLWHSDCDGGITPESCAKVADELEELLPSLDEMGGVGGHLYDGFGGAARRFIAGCRAAAAHNETLEFH